jgi:hypothetical protein
MPDSHLRFVRTSTSACSTDSAPALLLRSERRRRLDRVHRSGAEARCVAPDDQAGDRGEVQPARPPGRCGVTDQPQERMTQQFDALFTSDEDHAAAATQRIENQAYHEVQEAAAA